MIVLIGFVEESVMRHFAIYLKKNSYSFCFLNQRYLGSKWHFCYNVSNKNLVGGYFKIGKDKINFDSIKGIYARIGKISTNKPNRPEFKKTKTALEGLSDILNHINCKVVNKPSSMLSNSTKPYHLSYIGMQMNIRGGCVPNTYLTNKPVIVSEIMKNLSHEHILKSMCSVRSKATLMSTHNNSHIKLAKNCPIQLQDFIVGTNIRIHVVGKKVLPVAVKTDGIDYRYANSSFHLLTLDKELENACIKLTQDMKLDFAGIDMLYSPKGIYILEVNPSPGYSYFELKSGIPISKHLAEYLYENDY